MDDFLRLKKKIGFWGILGPPSYGIGVTICISREMLILPYGGFFFNIYEIYCNFKKTCFGQDFLEEEDLIKQ